MFCFGDDPVLDEPDLLPLLANVKFLFICDPLHKNGPPIPTMNAHYIINRTKEYFKGHYIFFTTYNKMHKHDVPFIYLNLNYYYQVAGQRCLAFPQSHICTTVFILMHLLQYKLKNPHHIRPLSTRHPPQKLVTISDNKYEVHYYGILGESEGHIGRPYSEKITKLRNQKMLQGQYDFVKKHPSLNSGNPQMLAFKTHILGIYNYFSETIDFTLH